MPSKIETFRIVFKQCLLLAANVTCMFGLAGEREK